MKEVSLSGSIRQNVGKKDATALRNAGLVPCVLYGGAKQIHFSVNHIAMEKLVYTASVNIINIEVDGKAHTAIIQEIQHHPVTDRIRHVDFIELIDNKKVKIEIPVVLEGRSLGVLNGGKLSQVYRKLKVFAAPSQLPDQIKIDISDLRIGGSIRVRDLIEKTGLDFLNAPSAVVCSVKMSRGAVLSAEEEAAAEAAEAGEAASAEPESAE